MVTVCGPIVTAPLRATVPVLAATVIVSVRDALPLAFAGSEIQAAGLAAVHAQPVRVSTVKVTSPPFGETVEFVGVTLYRQGAAS
jgi:hypothetical protein